MQPTVCRIVRQAGSPSVLALRPSGTHDQTLAVVKTVAVLFVGGVLPVERKGLSCNNVIGTGRSV